MSIDSPETINIQNNLVDFEKWFPQDGITLINPDSPLTRLNPKETQAINKLFDDLGANIYWLADVANERQSHDPLTYKKMLEELRTAGEALHLFMDGELDIYKDDDASRLAQQRGDMTHYWTGRGISSKFEDYKIRFLIREKPLETFGQGTIEETREARFSLQIEHKPSKTALQIRIDPDVKGQVCYDIDIPSLKEGLVNLNDTRQKIINGKPTHHILNNRLKFGKDEFEQTLQVLRKHIDSRLGHRSYERAA